MTALVAAAMLADLLTFAAVIETVGIGAEQNPVMASGYTQGGIVAVAALKLTALAAIVLLVARVRRPRLRVLAAGIAIVVGVTGAASNVTAWAQTSGQGNPAAGGAGAAVAAGPAEVDPAVDASAHLLALGDRTPLLQPFAGAAVVAEADSVVASLPPVLSSRGPLGMGLVGGRPEPQGAGASGLPGRVLDDADRLPLRDLGRAGPGAWAVGLVDAARVLAFGERLGCPEEHRAVWRLPVAVARLASGREQGTECRVAVDEAREVLLERCHGVSLLLRLSTLSVTPLSNLHASLHRSSAAASTPRAALESIPAVSRPVGQVTLDDPAQLGQPDQAKAVIPAPDDRPKGPGRITPPRPAIGIRPAPTEEPRTALVLRGIASFVGPGYGPRYLALPDGPGVTVYICGPVACVVRTSTDAGPDLAMQRAGRVADLSFADFRRVCGCDPWAVGLVRVTVAPIPAPPVTSTKETP